MRATASSKPRTIPISIETAARPSVTARPRRIESAVSHFATTPHSKFLLLATIQPNLSRMARLTNQSSQ